MKIKPEVFLGSQKNIAFNKILITGSDESFIAFVKNYIIEDFKRRSFFIDLSNNFNSGSLGSLFSDNKTLFVLSNFPTDKESGLLISNSQSVLVTSPNGKKNKCC